MEKWNKNELGYIIPYTFMFILYYTKILIFNLKYRNYKNTVETQNLYYRQTS